VIYISDDNGENWLESGRINKDVDYITTVAKYNNKIFVGTNNYGVFESDDTGKSWRAITNGLSGEGAETVEKLVVRGDSLYAGTGGAGVFVLNLKGVSLNWNHFNNGLSSNYSYSVFSLRNINNRLFLGAGISANYYINEMGSSLWKEFKLPDFNSMIMYDFLEHGEKLFMTVSLGLCKSTDGGESFYLLYHNIGGTNNSSLTSHGSDIYISYSKQVGTFWFKSSDMGESITRIEDQYGIDVYGITVINNKLFAARADGLWYRDLAVTSVTKKNILENFILHQNYPNPFNPITRVNFSLPKTGQVTLKIYDTLGNEILTLLDEEKPRGECSVEFNAASLSSGIYFYELRTNEFAQTKKMLLLK
jgi:hypothetical protein